MANLFLLWKLVLVTCVVSTLAAVHLVDNIRLPPRPIPRDVSLYDPFTEWCCHGHPLPRPDNPSSWQCCDQQLCPADSSTSQCCQGNSVDFSQDWNTSCVFDYGCCSGITYDKTAQRCCKGYVRDIPYHEVDPIGEDDCDDDVIQLISFNDWECCGDQLINTATHVCCNEQPIRTKIPNAACCNNEVFNRRTQSCCTHEHGQLIVPGGIDRMCCNGSTYNPKSQLCCSHYESVSGLRRFRVADIKTDFDGCCGLNIYNHATHICCYQDSTVIPKPVGSDASSSFGCCGGKPVDYQHQGCCGTERYDRNCEKACCGTTLYDVTENKLCCWSTEAKSQVLVGTDGDRNARCCGGKAYHPSYQLCCNQHIIDLRIRRIPFAVHGSPAHEVVQLDFDPDGHSDRYTIWRRPGAYACCGDREYNRNTQRCCGVNIFEAVKYPITYRCCSNDMYHPHKEVCCRGQVLRIDSGGATQCCYSWCSGDSCNNWPFPLKK